MCFIWTVKRCGKTIYIANERMGEENFIFFLFSSCHIQWNFPASRENFSLKVLSLSRLKFMCATNSNFNLDAIMCFFYEWKFMEKCRLNFLVKIDFLRNDSLLFPRSFQPSYNIHLCKYFLITNAAAHYF